MCCGGFNGGGATGYIELDFEGAGGCSNEEIFAPDKWNGSTPCDPNNFDLKGIDWEAQSGFFVSYDGEPLPALCLGTYPVAHQATPCWMLGSDSLRNPNIYTASYLRDMVSW